ncbi:Hsp33 family molecular chaperone HslO [Isachenkonia alkalipeptolytica]|uniref:33 kDa chaperonin n=1 Tax=Isachenkonia alkalipeptolytica TaxID=2565777 RepID=A0AA44BGQ0_9CLOT|nr:Hsp33 family molecular chaperone HslO [Isachenkonia alkalipeptolytica]
MKSKILRGTAFDGQVRIFIANTTNFVEKAKEIHQTSPVATAALGRVLTATSILGVMLKGERDKITTRINGQGPIGTIIATSDASGNVKGYVTNPQVMVESKTPGKLNVGAAVGKDGEITVIKDLGLKNPYIGNYPLVNGEIGEDLAAYFMYSEQQPSAVGLGVTIEKDYTIKSAGGFILQILPDTDENVAYILEERVKEAGSISKLIENSRDEKEIMNQLLEGLNPKVLEEYEVDYFCDCNRGRFEKALISLGKEEIMTLIEEDHGAELQCHFCNEKYQFSQKELESLMKEATSTDEKL